MPLTDAAIRRGTKPGRYWDGAGLYLEVAESGTRAWRLKYRAALPDGRRVERRATLGRYGTAADELTLAAARAAAADARALIAAGRDPTVEKKVAKAKQVMATGDTFAEIAAAWQAHAAKVKGWSQDYVDEVRWSLDKHVLPTLGPLPIADITPSIIAPLLDDLSHSVPHIAAKVERRLHGIFGYAAVHGRVSGDPVVRGQRKAPKTRHFPSIKTLPGLGKVLRDALATDPCKGIQRAHILLAFTTQRIGEVVGATWQEFDLTKGVWSIPWARMKRKDENRPAHVVSLPPTLLNALRSWKAADGTNATNAFVCHAPRGTNKHVTPEGVEKFYSSVLGLTGKHSPHSWRSSFSTVMHDAGKPHDLIEAQLDHALHGGNTTAGAYDHGDRLAARVGLMTEWESMLLSAQQGATVVPIRRNKA